MHVELYTHRFNIAYYVVNSVTPTYQNDWAGSPVAMITHPYTNYSQKPYYRPFASRRITTQALRSNQATDIFEIKHRKCICETDMKFGWLTQIRS